MNYEDDFCKGCPICPLKKILHSFCIMMVVVIVASSTSWIHLLSLVVIIIYTLEALEHIFTTQWKSSLPNETLNHIMKFSYYQVFFFSKVRTLLKIDLAKGFIDKEGCGEAMLQFSLNLGNGWRTTTKVADTT